MNAEKYCRKLSDNEQLYIYMQEIYSSFAINLVVEGKGEIDPTALQAAVEKASDACPGARLLQSGRIWIDSGRSPPVHLLNDSDFNGKNFSKIERLEQKMDPENGPTSEVLILQLNPMILVFRVFHGTMDGKGVMLWINNIFRALRGDPLILVKENESDLEFIKHHKHYSRKNSLHLSTQTLEKQNSAKNYKIWRQRLTLPGRSSCLVAKVAEIITTCGVSNTNQFLVPVDIRRHQKNYLSNANLTLPIFLETTKDETWTEIHKKLLIGLQNNQEMNLRSADLGLISRIPQFLFKWGMRAFLAYQNMINKQIIGGVISDLGFIDLDALTTDNFQAQTLYSLTVQQPLAPFTVAIASNKNNTEIMISCYENEKLISQAKNILKKIKVNFSSNFDYDYINHTEKVYPHHKTVVHLIQEQIVKSPDATAIQFANKKISYANLGEQIDFIAQYLSSRGVKSGDFVAIYMGRNEFLIPTILAVLKMGAAYVPIDSDSPHERLNNTLKHSKASICISESNLKNNLSLIKYEDYVLIDQVKIDNQNISFYCSSKPNKIAYQIYTSGSTGTPKGVQIKHQSLTNYLIWAKEEYKVSEQSTFPLFASIAFDSTITSMFLPLISGACIEVFDESINHLTLKKIFQSHAITHVKISPAHLQLIVNVKHVPGCPKTLILGGEQLSLKLAEKAFNLYGGEWKFINEYGPTEATIGSVTYTYDQKRELSGFAVPIGRPIMNTRVYLLDDNQCSVSAGAIGEIYLSGDCLANGYAYDSKFTNQNFITLGGGERAYKTGDLAKFTESGDLVYVGRIDNQICVNGHRIELGEIENAILDFNGITEITVIAEENNPGRSTLIAFYTSEDLIDELALKKHLQNVLPTYMQVHFFVRMDTLPLTINNKIDRKALPIPNIDIQPNYENHALESTNSQEQALIDIWREVLELESNCHINLNDNFYESGGDSLGMLIVFNEIIQRILGKEYEKAFMDKMSKMIKSPTIQNLSKTISSIKHTRNNQQLRLNTSMYIERDSKEMVKYQ